MRSKRSRHPRRKGVEMSGNETRAMQHYRSMYPDVPRWEFHRHFREYWRRSKGKPDAVTFDHHMKKAYYEPKGKVRLT